MNNAKQEIKYINYQEIVSVVSIIAVVISITLLQNEKKRLKKELLLFNNKKAKEISLFNRYLLIIVALSFLYINYKLRSISKINGENLKPYNLQILASILTVVASIIALYVVTIPNEDITNIENPII